MDRSGSTLTPRRVVVAAVAVAAAAVSFVGSTPALARSRQTAPCTIGVADDTYTTVEAKTLTVVAPGVVANDTICGTDGLVISVTQPAHGTLANFDDDDGGFTYTPDGAFQGTDTFTYRLEDVPDSPVATVSITVPGCCTTVSMTTGSTPTTGTTSSTPTSGPTSTTVAPASTPATPVAAAPSFTG